MNMLLSFHSQYNKFHAIYGRLFSNFDRISRRSDALCDDMDVDRQELENKMAEAGLEYNAAANKFW